MARVVTLFGDLLLGSNVLGMLRAAGYEAELHPSAGAAERHAAGAAVLVVDLTRDGAFDGVEVVERLRAKGDLDHTRVLGVYSHVDVEMRRRAEAAGFDLVVPRSRVVREGLALVAGLVDRRS